MTSFAPITEQEISLLRQIFCSEKTDFLHYEWCKKCFKVFEKFCREASAAYRCKLCHQQHTSHSDAQIHMIICYLYYYVPMS